MEPDFVLVDETPLDFLSRFEWDTQPMQDWMDQWARERAVKREIEARREIDQRTRVSSRGLRYLTGLHADPRWGGPRRVLP